MEMRESQRMELDFLAKNEVNISSSSSFMWTTYTIGLRVKLLLETYPDHRLAVMGKRNNRLIEEERRRETSNWEELAISSTTSQNLTS